MFRPRMFLFLIALAATFLVVALPGRSGPEPEVADAGAEGARRGQQAIEGRYIVAYKSFVDAPARKTDKLERAKGFKSSLRYGRALKGFAAKLSPGQVRALRADPAVALVAPDRPVKALGSVPLASGEPTPPPGLRRIGAATASTTREASGANVAVLDTGVDLDHPDLNVTSGKNCVTPGATADDDQGHGTHVAGTVAAENDGSGLVGVAPGSKIFAAKVLDGAGSGTTSQVICGIDWVTSTRTDSDPANDIAVANMSLGGSGTSVQSCATTTDPQHKAICNSTARGVTYVVAAGNSGWDFDYAPQPDTPAAYPEALTVAAMGDSDGRSGGTGGNPVCRTGEADDRYASFSNYAATAQGEQHTIAAPGVCIRSTAPGGSYQTMSGTSMATPHVAGAVALCIDEGGSAGPCAGLSPGQITEKVRADAQSRLSADPGYGYAGDPGQPVSGKYFGYLTWAGTTAPDTTAPAIDSVSPAANATGVDPAGKVSVTFSEPMDRAATEAAFSLAPTGGAKVAGSFSWSGNTMAFDPSIDLANGAEYTATVGSGAKDTAGNALAAGKSWAFKTKTLTAVTGFPSATGIFSGKLRSGTYSRLGADDNSYYQVNSTTSGTRVSDWYGRFSSVTNALSNLKITYKGSNSASCAQRVYVYRFDGSPGWVQLDSRSVSTTEVLVSSLAPSGAPADYVSGTSGDGEVRVRVRCARSSPSFYASGDLLKIGYERP